MSQYTFFYSISTKHYSVIDNFAFPANSCFAFHRGFNLSASIVLSCMSRLSSIGKLEQHSSVGKQNPSTFPSSENRASLMMLSGLNESRDFLEITEQRVAMKGRRVISVIIQRKLV